MVILHRAVEEQSLGGLIKGGRQTNLIELDLERLQHVLVRQSNPYDEPGHETVDPDLHVRGLAVGVDSGRNGRDTRRRAFQAALRPGRWLSHRQEAAAVSRLTEDLVLEHLDGVPLLLRDARDDDLTEGRGGNLDEDLAHVLYGLDLLDGRGRLYAQLLELGFERRVDGRGDHHSLGLRGCAQGIGELLSIVLVAIRW